MFPFFQLKVPTSDKPGVFVNFRKLLLNRCQKEFEKDQDDDEIFEKKQKEIEAAKDVRNSIFYSLMSHLQLSLVFGIFDPNTHLYLPSG